MSVSFHLELCFKWPAGEPDEDYEAGDDAEINLSYPVAVPIPGVGERVIFDPEDPPIRGGLHNPVPERRFFEGLVERRDFEYTDERYVDIRTQYVSVRLHLGNVRRHSNDE